MVNKRRPETPTAALKLYIFLLSSIGPELFKLERSRIKLIIGSLFRDKLIMASALDYSAVVKHHDNIRISDR